MSATTSGTFGSAPLVSAQSLTQDVSRSTYFLDGMRGLAAFYVLMSHITWLPTPGVSGRAWRIFYSILEHIFRFGHTSVIFFLVLSGFVIHLRYAQQLQGHPNAARFDWSNFFYRRIRRLYPPLVAAIILTWVFDHLSNTMGYPGFYEALGPHYSFVPPSIQYNHTLPTLLGNLVFLMQIHVPAWGTDSPLWSLAYEWWFYMLYPLLWILNRRSVALATTCVVGAFLMTRLAGSWPGIQLGATGFRGRHALDLPWRVLGAFPTWWCGALLADVYAKRIRISFKWLSLLMFFLLFTSSRDLPEAMKAIATGIGFAGVIAFAFYLQECGFRLTLLHKLKFLGDFSYSLYVTHLPFVIFLAPFCISYLAGRFPGSVPAGFLILLICPMLLAYFVYLIAEKPFLSHRKRHAPTA